MGGYESKAIRLERNVKASVFRRWPVTRAYSPGANHPTGGYDYVNILDALTPCY